MAPPLFDLQRLFGAVDAERERQGVGAEEGDVGHFEENGGVRFPIPAPRPLGDVDGRVFVRR